MKIYLDTKDLIEIIEKSRPISPTDFRNMLSEKSYELVISNTLLLELSEPLRQKSKKTNVMSNINILEKIPHIFINTKNLIYIELLEALEAFNNGREYKNVDPFTYSFTETLELEKHFPLGKYIIYSLAEIIWYLFNEQELGGYDKHSKRWRDTLVIERNLPKKLSKKKNFIFTIKKHLSLFKVRLSTQMAESFAKWIHEKSFRCPSTRLINEIYHKLEENIGDIPKDSDLEDIMHIQCLPYVDFMTVDRRMYEYISQAAKSLNRDYDRKLSKSVEELLKSI